VGEDRGDTRGDSDAGISSDDRASKGRNGRLDEDWKHLPECNLISSHKQLEVKRQVKMNQGESQKRNVVIVVV
jgi:hypothetical protein